VAAEITVSGQAPVVYVRTAGIQNSIPAVQLQAAASERYGVQAYLAMMLGVTTRHGSAPQWRQRCPHNRELGHVVMGVGGFIRVCKLTSTNLAHLELMARVGHSPLLTRKYAGHHTLVVLIHKFHLSKVRVKLATDYADYTDFNPLNPRNPRLISCSNEKRFLTQDTSRLLKNSN
jgi:hypothetical protein